MALRPGLTTEPGAALDEQATNTIKPRKRGRRGGRRRGKSQTIARQINAAAEQRRRAYAEGEQPNLTQKLTTDLNGREHVMAPEGLYAAGREEDAGTMEPGRPKVSQAFPLLHEYGKRTGKPDATAAD